jgi:N-methylhydantoinase B/oxoprolinase/acetone carboxylase alpha subunit
MDCAGGGGYGDPGGRDRALIERDVREGKVTPQGAERDYGIGKASVPRRREPSTA